MLTLDPDTHATLYTEAREALAAWGLGTGQWPAPARSAPT